MKSAFYGFMVKLHPPEFRDRFGRQMESIFDDSRESTSLLVDICISVVRQWLLRSSFVWVFALAAVGGMIPFGLGIGILHVSRTYFGIPALHRTAHGVARAHRFAPPVTEPFLMLTAAIAVMFISGTMLFAITWFRFSRVRQSRFRDSRAKYLRRA